MIDTWLQTHMQIYVPTYVNVCNLSLPQLRFFLYISILIFIFSLLIISAIILLIFFLISIGHTHTQSFSRIEKKKTTVICSHFYIYHLFLHICFVYYFDDDYDKWLVTLVSCCWLCLLYLPCQLFISCDQLFFVYVYFFFCFVILFFLLSFRLSQFI